MKFENVNQELIKWVDRGFFKNIWYYIKDISNYSMLFILEDLDYYDPQKPIHEIDNHERYLMGKLNSDGYFDYYGLKHPIGFPQSVGDSEQVNEIYSKYNDLEPVSCELNRKAFIEIDVTFARKIDETFYLLMINSTRFKDFLKDLMESMYSYNSQDNDDHYDCNLSFVSETKLQNYENDYQIFFGFDTDEYWESIKIEANLIPEQIIADAKKLLEAEVKESLHLNNFKGDLANQVKSLDKKYHENIFSDYLLIDYHKVIENMAEEIYKTILPNLLNALDNLDLNIISKKPNNAFRRNIDLIRSKKEKYEINSINTLQIFFSLLINKKLYFSSNVIDDSAKKWIINHIDELRKYDIFSKTRNIKAHKFQMMDKDRILASIHIYRLIIKYLDEFYGLIQKK